MVPALRMLARMVRSSLRPIVSMVLGLTACTAPRTPPAAPIELDAQEIAALDRETWHRIVLLADAEQRERLRAKWSRAELEHVTFDGDTIADCIDELARATAAERAGPFDDRARQRTDAAFAAYVAAARELTVRRSAGAASCLPTLR